MKPRRHKDPIEKIVGLDHIIELIYENMGRLSFVAKQLGVSLQTIYEMIDRNPDLKQTIEHARYIARESRVDDCEVYVESIAERYEEDTTNGLKAAQYCLNTHGRHRGWGKPEEEEQQAETSTDALKKKIQESNAE
jgi:hypothetical protein